MIRRALPVLLLGVVAACAADQAGDPAAERRFCDFVLHPDPDADDPVAVLDRFEEAAAPEVAGDVERWADSWRAVGELDFATASEAEADAVRQGVEATVDDYERIVDWIVEHCDVTRDELFPLEVSTSLPPADENPPALPTAED